MIKILFVCHGNICRSVGAQYILQDMVNRRGLAGDFLIESAAATTEEIGNPIYPPMERALRKKGIPIGDHRARQLRKADYNRYDLLIGMDEENLSDMNWILGGDPEEKLHFLMEYTDRPEHKIEDPWYTRQFEVCADEIIEGCEGLLGALKQKRC